MFNWPPSDCRSLRDNQLFQRVFSQIASHLLQRQLQAGYYFLQYSSFLQCTDNLPLVNFEQLLHLHDVYERGYQPLYLKTLVDIQTGICTTQGSTVSEREGHECISWRTPLLSLADLPVLWKALMTANKVEIFLMNKLLPEHSVHMQSVGI